MKKIIAIVLATVMMLTLMLSMTSCDVKELLSFLDKGEDDNKLVMATNAYFQPYEYYEGDKIVGIDAEIAAAIAEYLDMELEIVNMEFDSIITAVNAGDVDFGMAGMTVTEERLLEVDFSSSYATGVQAIIVKENSPIKSVDDLYAEGADYKVGVQAGTTGDITLPMTSVQITLRDIPTVTTQ